MKNTTKKRVVSTKLSIDYYDKLHAYAVDKGISLYEALSELLLYALHMKESESKNTSTLLEGIKGDLKDVKNENDERYEELMKYIKRIYYLKDLRHYLTMREWALRCISIRSSSLSLSMSVFSW